MTDVPVIDFSPFLTSADEGRQDVARQIAQACQDAGFFYLTGHGISDEASSAVFESMQWLFALDIEQKRLLWRTPESPRGYYLASEVYAHKGKITREAFIIMSELAADDPDVVAGTPLHGSNHWPADNPGFKAAALRYFDEGMQLADALIDAFSMGLDIPSDRLRRNYRKPMSNLQMNFYPGQPDNQAKELGLPPHRDTGGFTILMTDQTSGLQIKGPSDEWIDAPVVEGAVIVNVANMLEMQTNGIYRSVVHRVVNRSNAARYSLPLFINPDWDAEIFPEPEFVQAVGESRYSEPLDFGPWYYNILYGSTTNTRTDVVTEVTESENINPDDNEMETK